MSDPARPPSFTFSFTADAGPAPKPIKRRGATAEERLYLRRFNRLRGLRRLMFMGNFLFVGGIAGALVWIGITTLDRDGYVMPAALFLMLCLLAAGVALSGWGAGLVAFLRMRRSLRVPDDLKVGMFSDRLRTLAHPTRDSTNIFAFDRCRDLVEMPAHWERDIVARGALPDQDQPVEIAHLPDASGTVLRLPMTTRYRSTRIDPTLPDPGVFLLRLGNRSIAREMRAGLPLLRAQTTVLAFGFGAAVLGALASLFCWFLLAERMDERTGLRSTVTRLEQTYGGGAEIPLDALIGRGLDDLRPDPEFGNRVLHAGPVSFRTVSLSRDADPVLMSGEEIGVVDRISRVFPASIPGAGPANPALIAAYRDQLMQGARSLSRIAPNLPDRIAALPDALVAAQMRALPYRNAPDRAFVEAVLPKPAIRPEGRSHGLVPMGPSCLVQDILCGQRDPAEAYETPVLVSGRSGITLRDGTDLDRLAEARERLRGMEAETGPPIAVAACATSLLLPVLCILAWAEANWRIRRWYRSGGSQG
ncbi:hypothetical protein [Rhodovulum sp. YEN HP10]|uniref:hypothetical protein n=1 Tax=Rhodovulum sp. HP10 TaxID=3387397 RepID=UPI0039E0493F